GCLTLDAQAKLLRVLQEGEVERVGGLKARRIDVRVVGATNEDLATAINSGKFREDLYYRINVFPIYVPALRERKADIPILANYFLDRYSSLHHHQVTGYSEAALAALLDYEWPGNIRELENVVERAVILASDGEAIGLAHLPPFS
ncbi:MAG TPA: sigma 54-interacting transcriptional regulator, partial [Bellilinea sp.]|nr:sigma 54-interacting transcriptional regulator [Bellilinea sp.]